MSYEREYCHNALEALRPHLSLLPPKVQRAVNLAASVMATGGEPTVQELRHQLGENWVLARRTKGIVERYGKDVRCYSLQQYKKAERAALEERISVSHD